MNRPSADLAGGGPTRFFASASSLVFRGRARLRRRGDDDDFRTRFLGGSDFDDSDFRGRPRPRFLTVAEDAALLATFVSGGVFRLGVGGDFAVGVVLSRLLVEEDARGFDSSVSTPAEATNK